MLKQELADMMTAATMSEQANREELSSLRQQYDEQIVTMQGVLEGQCSPPATPTSVLLDVCSPLLVRVLRVLAGRFVFQCHV